MYNILYIDFNKLSNNKKVDRVLLFEYYRTMDNINLVKIFKALSSEQRFLIFQMLYEWQQTSADEQGNFTYSDGMEKCFTKACCCMSLSKSTISHHFKELENAGLISCSRNGQSFLCKVNLEAVEEIRSFLK